MRNGTETTAGKPLDEMSRQIAMALGETEPTPLLHIRRPVQTLGLERALQLLEYACAVEAKGGFMLSDGSRHTPGGVFFPARVTGQTATKRC